MNLPSHLRLSRHGVWCFRLVLPDVLAKSLGQKEIITSLGTKRPEVARLTAYSLSARLVPLLRTLRRTLAIDPNSIDPKSVRELIIKGIKREGNSVSAEYVETTRTDPEGMAQEERIVEKIFSPSAPSRTISEAEAAYLEEGRNEILRMFGGKQPDIPETLGKAIESFMGSKADLSAATKKLYRSRLEVFASLAGGTERMVHAITAADCVRAKEALEKLPAHAGKRKNPPTSDAKPLATIKAPICSGWGSGAGL